MSATSRSLFIRGWFAVLVVVGLLCFGAAAEANIIEYKDTLSTSAAATSSNHTIQFRTTTAMDPGDYIRFRPDPGSFTIPTSTSSTTGFSTEQVELYVNSGGGFTQRTTGTTTGTSTDGVVITRGTSGDVTITLNSLTGIPANSVVRVLIGNHTTNSTSTNLGILNPSATTSYPFFIEKGGSNNTTVQGWVAIVDQVGILVDTTEEIPPLRFNGAPTGTIAGTVNAVVVSLNTNEFATCRFANSSGVDYASMSNTFTVTGGVTHSIEYAVATSTTYNFYVRCIDDEGNFNTDDYLITFTIDDPPTGVPGDGEGTDPGDDEGTGTGSGSSGSGSGSSAGGGGGGGSGGSGSGSGGGEGDDSGSQGAGGFESQDDAYPSGEGRVIVNGYAFPNRTVVILVDGTVAANGRADSSGKFAITLDEIASGVYNVGVYAIDVNNVRSSTFSTTFTVTGSRTTTLSNINVMPSILVDPDPVDPGQQLTISGYTIPNAAVTIENRAESTSASLRTFNTTSNTSGAWSIEVDTSNFITGTYQVRARALQSGGVSTNFSEYTFYGVGEEASTLDADLNRDGRVDLIDFSILLFWWGTDGGDSSPPADINRDGNTSLTDFSILLFQWTG